MSTILATLLLVATAAMAPMHDGAVGGTRVAGAGDPRILAAGDIACAPGKPTTRATCREGAVARLIRRRPAAKVLAIGDTQYETGALFEYLRSYADTWGRFKRRTRPVPGNHEYLGRDRARGYFDYFGARAGPRGKGYYSFDLGAWHIIALNSQIARGDDSAQMAWLQQDLASNPSTCTLAYFHHPRFSSGVQGNDETTASFWTALYAAGADVVLAGHDHIYERFAPQSPAGTRDPANGIREFVVGTGGASHKPFGEIQPNSRVRNRKTFGVLSLRLHESSYNWRFIPIKGQSFTDSGRSACH